MFWNKRSGTKHIVLFFALLWLAFVCCTSSKKMTSEKAIILETFGQKYSGGVKGTPSGIKYKLRVIALGNHLEFKVNGLWFDSVYSNATAFRDKRGVNKMEYNKGDTLTVLANFIKSGAVYKASDASVAMTKPSGFANKLLLYYSFKTINAYSGTDKITELPEELRP